MHQVLIHDLVEIDAGDTFCYDQAAHQDKAEREQQAAERIFGCYPPPWPSICASFGKSLKPKTPTARFAAALDRLQPLLHNWQTEGGTWKQHNIQRAPGDAAHCAPLKQGLPELWPFVLELVQDCVAGRLFARIGREG
jgi:putative hydrolase of HD superfamily